MLKNKKIFCKFDFNKNQEMEITYKKVEAPLERPCLMVNEYSELFLVTDGSDGKIFVTRMMPGDEEECMTWESDLQDYKPLPKGATITIVN